MAFQQFSNSIYRFLSRTIARAVGRLDFVESVFLRRTAATGEVAFGRSDIDLTIVLTPPLAEGGEPARLLQLVRSRQSLKAVIPLLGECEAATAAELIRSYRADPFRASVDRQTAALLFGKPFDIPDVPVSKADALTWMLIWFAHYLPLAMRQGDRRNMRKYALEIWNAARVATGDIYQPYPTKARAESAWKAAACEAFPLSGADNIESLFAVCCSVISEVHSRLCSPLEVVETPAIHTRDGSRWVLVPSSTRLMPPEVRQTAAFAGAPEALDLFIQHVNPRMYAHLPDSVARLGIRRPGYAEWLDFCRRFAADPRLLRRPGLSTSRKLSYYAPELIFPGREAARELRAGCVPVWSGMPDEQLRKHPPSYHEYYTFVFPQLYNEIHEAWNDLDQCERADPVRNKSEIERSASSTPDSK